MSIAAQFVGAAGGEVYIAHQYVPSPTTFDESSADPRRMGQQVLIASAQEGTYFVLVHGREASSGGKPFTSPTVLPLQVTSISPNHGSNLGLTTITVHSALFSGGTTVTLVPGSGGTPIAASQVTIEDGATLFANLTSRVRFQDLMMWASLDGAKRDGPGRFHRRRRRGAGAPGSLPDRSERRPPVPRGDGDDRLCQHRRQRYPAPLFGALGRQGHA